MDELKPCPFCGGKADYVGTEIECLECGVMMPKTFAFEMQVDNWNTRPIEDALRAQLAEAQAEVDTKWNISLLDSDDPDVDGEFDTLSEDHNGTVSIEKCSYTVIDGWDTTERVLAWRKVRL